MNGFIYDYKILKLLVSITLSCSALPLNLNYVVRKLPMKTCLKKLSQRSMLQICSCRSNTGNVNLLNILN
ncbi:hypothetical protein Hanom_Chr00s084073g01795671 [Helianthus anomalus]